MQAEEELPRDRPQECSAPCSAAGEQPLATQQHPTGQTQRLLHLVQHTARHSQQTASAIHQGASVNARQHAAATLNCCNREVDESDPRPVLLFNLNKTLTRHKDGCKGRGDLMRAGLSHLLLLTVRVITCNKLPNEPGPAAPDISPDFSAERAAVAVIVMAAMPGMPCRPSLAWQCLLRC